ncbi:hypothetical protein M513_14326, partial [Trichuris suis]
FGVPTLQAATA